MKIEGNYPIKAPRADLWRMLIDPAVLQRCVPGCESLEAAEDGSYKMVMKAGVGSIKGAFTGKIKLDELRAPEHYKMLVEANGKVGFVKGVGTLDFIEQGAETVINYAGEVSVGGTLASVGQRMIQASAKMLAGQFFKAIEAEARPTDAADAAQPGLARRIFNRVTGTAEEQPPETKTQADPQ